MLARRFTIVCLLTALFGMFFSMLVIQAERSSRSREYGMVRTCSYEFGLTCSPSNRL